MITPDMLLEDILDRYPQAITYFILEGISPMCCAGVPSESLDSFLKRKKAGNVDDFISGLSDFIMQKNKN